MSENLKRAESLFNRIMNQNPDSKSGSSATSGTHHSTQPHKYKSYNNNHSHHKSNISSNGNLNSHHVTPNSDLLPKRDPLKAAEDTLSQIPEGHHILPYCWTIWHHSRGRLKQKDGAMAAAVAAATAATAASEVADEDSSTPAVAAAAVDSYLQTTNEIEFSVINGDSMVKSIGSLEQLWMSMSSIKKSYELRIGTELLFFKSGINPVWEDPVNAKGGRWVFRFNRKSGGSGNGSGSDDQESASKIRKRTSLIWERLVIKTLTGSLIPDGTNSTEFQELLLNDISGVVLSVRKDEDIISVWNSNFNFGGKAKKDDKKLSSFQARRIICDSILRVIRECDLILQGHDCVDTVDNGSNERVLGVSFDYRLHTDNNNPLESSSSRYSHHHHHRRYYSKKNDREN